MNNHGRTISILKVSAAAALIGLLLACDPALGQSSDSLKYFPCDSGDTWFYYGEDGYSTIKVDCVFNHQKGKLVYMTDGEYLIDTTFQIVYTVFPYRAPSDTLWETYRLNAQVGECWPYDSSSYRWNGVGLRTGDSVVIFGVPTRVKTFEFFHFYSDTGTPSHDPRQWFSYMTRTYAYGFGMIEEGLEGGGGRVLIGAILNGDSMGIILDVKEKRNNLPDRFTLYQNYPNPFNPSTAISYQLTAVSRVTLKIYDILGREVKTLVEERETAGQHVVYWDGTDRYGRRVASGIYYYRLATPGGSITRKAVLIK